MATYKGIGFDSTNGRVRTGSSSDLVSFDTNVNIAGNLDVTGNIISRDEERVLVQDNFLDLNVGYTTATGLSGGIAVNVLPVAGGLSINSTGNTLTFAAASGGTRPSVTAASASGIPSGTFAAGDVLQIAGTTNAENDGFYIVNSNTAGVIEIRSTAITSPDTINLKAAQVNFTADAESTATAVTFTKVLVSVLQANASTGVFETQEGNTDSAFATFDQLGGSLQVAYGLGNSITTASSTAIQFTLSSGDFKVDDGTVDFGSVTALTAFNSVAAATSIESTGTSGGDLFLSHANSGSAGIALGHSGTTQQLGVDVNGIALDDDGTFGKASGSAQTFSKDGSGADADDLEIAMIMSGTVRDSSLILSSDGNGSDAIKIQTLTNAGGIQINADGALDVAAGDDSQIIQTANSAGAKTLTIQSTNSGGGDASIQINADTIVEIVGQLQADATAGVGLKFGSSGNVVDTILDEDTMASNDANALATQQSIKAYVDGVGVADFSKILTLTADASGVAAGDVVAIDSSGNATKANAGAAATANVVGIAIETAGSGASVRVAQAGSMAGLSGLSAGDKLYASAASAGALVSTPPSSAGDVVFQVGYAIATDTIAIAPQYMMEIG
jgi:hypothetical protein